MLLHVCVSVSGIYLLRSSHFFKSPSEATWLPEPQANVPSPPCHPSLFTSPNCPLNLLLPTCPFCSQRYKLQAQGLCICCICSLPSRFLSQSLGVWLNASGLPSSGQIWKGILGRLYQNHSHLSYGCLNVSPLEP